MRNNLWEWQSLSPSSGGGTFFEFCDALEVKARIEDEMRRSYGFVWGVQIGFHAVPSMEYVLTNPRLRHLMCVSLTAPLSHVSLLAPSYALRASSDNSHHTATAMYLLSWLTRALLLFFTGMCTST